MELSANALLLPQWWSGCSTTAHIVLDLCSRIWGFSGRRTIVYSITSQPANVFSNVLYWHFRQSPTVWLQFQRGLSTPGLGVWAKWGSGWAHLITTSWVPIRSPLSYIHGLPLTVLGLHDWPQRRFCQPVPDVMTVTSLESLPSSSGKNKVQLLRSIGLKYNYKKDTKL